MRRERNSGRDVPVLLMNPDETMATRRRKRRPAARKRTTRAPARRAPARRRPVRRATRRRTQRRRNPKIDIQKTLMAGAGGAVMGLAAYAVRNQNLEPLTAAAVLGAGGLLLGAAAAGWKPSVGAGIAGGGAALATGLLIAIYYTKDTQTSGLGAYHTAKRFAGAQAHYPAMGAVTAQVGPRRQLVMNGLGAVTAPVSNSLQLDLNGLS